MISWREEKIFNSSKWNENLSKKDMLLMKYWFSVRNIMNNEFEELEDWQFFNEYRKTSKFIFLVIKYRWKILYFWFLKHDIFSEIIKILNTIISTIQISEVRKKEDNATLSSYYYSWTSWWYLKTSLILIRNLILKIKFLIFLRLNDINCFIWKKIDIHKERSSISS